MSKTTRRMVWVAALGATLSCVVWSALEPVRSEHPQAAVSAAKTARRAQKLPMQRASTLSGTVESVEGAAVIGAQVCAVSAAERALGGTEPRCTWTDSTGAYGLEGLEGGVYDVAVTAAHYVPAAISGERAVVVQRGRDVTGVDFKLNRGGARLAGLVLDATGGPIAGARIDVAFGEHERQSAQVEADLDGRFRVWLAPGHVSLTVRADGYASSRVGHVAPSDDVVIRLPPGASIRGKVVSTVDATPVSGVEVRAICARCMDTLASPHAVSAADGGFTIVGLGSGTYSLLAEGDGYRGQADQPVSLGLAQTLDDVVVNVYPTLEVVGRVLVKDGSACTSGLVTLGPAAPSPAMEIRTPRVPNLSAGIDEAGFVRFRSVPSGKYAVDVHCVDHALAEGPTTLEVERESLHDLAWRVTPGLVLRVRVVDESARSLANIPFVFVTLAYGTAAIFESGNDGTTTIGRHLVAGEYRVQPYTGYEGDPVAIELRERSGPVEATLVLRGSASLEVEVVDRAGTAVDSVRVAVAPRAPEDPAAPAILSSRPLREAIPRGHGRFQVDSLSAGSYEVRVDDGLNAPVVRPVEVRTGLVRERVSLDRDQILRGRVVDERGQPIPDVWVSARCARSHESMRADRTAQDDPALRALQDSKRSASDDRGQFELTGLNSDARSCLVRAEDPGISVGIQDEANPSDQVLLTMRALGSVAGVVRAPVGAPIILRIVNEQFRHERVVELVHGGGSFQLQGILPGSLKLVATSAQGSAEQSIELAPGATFEGVRLELNGPPPDAL